MKKKKISHCRNSSKIKSKNRKNDTPNTMHDHSLPSKTIKDLNQN